MNNAGFSFNSGEHLSALLYGGVVRFVESTPYLHTFKTGPLAGQTKERFIKKKIETTLPRLVEPLPKTELKKLGYWSTDASVLSRLKAKGTSRLVVELIKRRNELERLVSTYYHGIPKTIEEKDWEPGWLHGQFNQVTVVTGRTSSSSPNLQNMASEVDELIKTRF